MGEGAWQRLDLSQISRLEMVQIITRNTGSNSIPAYWDDIQLMTQAPSSDTYDVQVATDAAFTNVIQNETSVQADSVEAGSLAKGTTYLIGACGQRTRQAPARGRSPRSRRSTVRRAATT